MKKLLMITTLVASATISHAATPYTIATNGDIAIAGGTVVGNISLVGNFNLNLSGQNGVDPANVGTISTVAASTQQIFFIPIDNGPTQELSFSYSITSATGFNIADTAIWGSGGIFSSTGEQNAVIGSANSEFTITSDTGTFSAGDSTFLDATGFGTNELSITTTAGAAQDYAIVGENNLDGTSFGEFFTVNGGNSLTYEAQEGEFLAEHGALQLTLDITQVPEPSSTALLGLGGLALLARRKRA